MNAWLLLPWQWRRHHLQTPHVPWCCLLRGTRMECLLADHVDSPITMSTSYMNTLTVRPCLYSHITMYMSFIEHTYSGTLSVQSYHHVHVLEHTYSTTPYVQSYHLVTMYMSFIEHTYSATPYVPSYHHVHVLYGTYLQWNPVCTVVSS